MEPQASSLSDQLQGMNLAPSSTEAEDRKSPSDQVDEAALQQLVELCPCTISREYLAHMLSACGGLEVNRSLPFCIPILAILALECPVTRCLSA